MQFMLKQIKYFQSVIRCGSFTEAAAECYISQSAISQQIDGMSEEEILYGNIRAALTRKASEPAERYSGSGMELSLEIGAIESVSE